MSGSNGHQGRGLGRKLLRASVDRFAQLGGKLLYLESHSSLTAALTLYESAGFRHEPRQVRRTMSAPILIGCTAAARLKVL